MTIKAIIFDIGGTLVDDERLINLVKKNPVEYRLLKKYGYNGTIKHYITTAQEIRRSIPENKITTQAECNYLLIKKLGIKPTWKLAKEMNRAFRKFDREYLLKKTLSPSAIKLIKWINRHDIKLGIITNAHDSYARHLLKYFKITHLFSSIIISAERGIVKPNPKIFQIAVKELKVKAENILMVGNSSKDMAAQKIQIKTCLVSKKPEISLLESKPNYCVKKLWEIKKIID